ncbi:Cysteine-rich membrane protein 2 [Spironucleus salmonicida]|uniref:Cysteine-rich membrane protein 2 n=1 Tax=Spironucleus salmonicida TaxID=348837 RepID=V6LE31_9EUKA|nr:Cysteine-rich membrane protein 2 [Spironucleus salmonicida]|eukprot:EST41951.1 Cysteine-rich membrane protein 2 [Spironucleus salmonicida]
MTCNVSFCQQCDPLDPSVCEQCEDHFVLLNSDCNQCEAGFYIFNGQCITEKLNTLYIIIGVSIGVIFSVIAIISIFCYFKKPKQGIENEPLLQEIDE